MRMASKLEEGKDVWSEGITIVEPRWLGRVKELVAKDPYYTQIAEKLAAGKLDGTRYSHLEGIWYYKGRVLLNPEASLCHEMLVESHCTPAGGHEGYHRTVGENSEDFLE